ncbi:MAG: ParA family protein [Oscillospiraceae bacterium]|nr:ParA family protein [Oscillospiraceae bacterium]
MKVTAIMNLKGGTAKTVTAINMAAILYRMHSQRVLLVDADSQCNLTEFMTAELPKERQLTDGGLYDLLTGKPAVIRETSVPCVDILPATDDLMALDVNKAGGNGADIMAIAELRSREDERYGHMVIDCPPAFSAAAVAALIAADQVIIPMKLDAFGLRGMANLLCQVSNMQRVNPALTVAGILPTMYYKSAKMEEAEETLRASGLRVYPHVRRSVMVDEMTFLQTPLIFSSPKSGACRDYKTFVAEFMKGGEHDGV